MRYLLFGLLCTTAGGVIGWIMRGLVTREAFKRAFLRARANDLTPEQIRAIWESELK